MLPEYRFDKLEDASLSLLKYDCKRDDKWNEKLKTTY